MKHMRKFKLFRKREMIHFSGRSHSKIGILSTIIGITVVIGFLAISIISGVMHGDGGLLFGLIGLLLFGLAIFGFVLSYKSVKERDIFYRFPIIGLVINGFMTILLLIIYIVGFGNIK